MRFARAFREVADTPYRTGDTPSLAEMDTQNGDGDPDPSPDIDAIEAIEELGDEIATLAAHISAATHRFLTLIAEFDGLRGWELAGYQTCAHWLAFRTGIAMGAARERVRAARALTRLPLTGAAMSRGELSFSQVRALSRVANAENEADLLDLARGTTTEQLERMAARGRRGAGSRKPTSRRSGTGPARYRCFPAVTACTS